MTDTLDRLLRASAPIDDDQLRALQLDLLETELREAVLLYGEHETEPREAPGRPAERRRPLRWRLPGLAAAAALAGAALLAVTLVGGGDRLGAPPERAWAAPALRVANAVPRLLIGQPGWTVTRADEFSVREGEMTLRNGPRRVFLFWRPGSYQDWVDDRAHSAARLAPADVVGSRATVFRYRGANPAFTALWRSGRYTMELTGSGFSAAEYRRVLGSVKAVGVDEWLGAMPPSVVLPADSERVAAAMLAGIPRPDGFEPAPETGVRERYHLGARVAGGVACAWIEQWVEARAEGDAAAAGEAVEAMRTSRRWPILREMNAEGDYPEALWEFADAMRGVRAFPGATPRWVEENYRSGLGC
jgi:hypothetical protein